MNTMVLLAVLAGALMLAIALAFVPLRLLLSHIAANVQQFILRQRERRVGSRETPERRKREQTLS